MLGIKGIVYILVCGSAIALAACSPTLDAARVETAIKADLGKQVGLLVKAIHCPTDVKQAQGRSFECTGELEPDGGFFVTVQQQDDRGTVAWDVPHSWRLLNLTTLESMFQQALQTQSHVKPTVNCGGRYRATKPGDSFECRLTRRAVPAKTTSKRADETRADETIVIRVQPEGNVTWQAVQVIAAAPAVKTQRPETPGATPKSLAAEPSSTIGTKDKTGWVELGD